MVEWNPNDYELTGITKMLLHHCVLASWDENDNVVFCVDPKLNFVVNDERLGNITKAMSKYHNREVKVTINYKPQPTH